MHYSNLVLLALVASTKLGAARPIKRAPDWKSDKNIAIYAACGAGAFAVSVACSVANANPLVSKGFNAVSASGGAMASAATLAKTWSGKKTSPENLAETGNSPPPPNGSSPPSPGTPQSPNNPTQNGAQPVPSSSNTLANEPNDVPAKPADSPPEPENGPSEPKVGPSKPPTRPPF